MRGLPAGARDLSSQGRLALVVVLDRGVLADRLDEPRDVLAEALRELAHVGVGRLEHVVEDAARDDLVGTARMAQLRRHLERVLHVASVALLGELEGRPRQRQPGGQKGGDVGELTRVHTLSLSDTLHHEALERVARVTAGVDGLLEPLVDVLPADHDHRVDAAVEQRAERAALEPVALVLEVVDGEDVRAQLLAASSATRARPRAPVPHG